MSKLKQMMYLLITILFFLLTGCATTPSVQIWQPWTRVLSSDTPVPLNSRIKIAVEGKSKPLLGDELLLQKNIFTKIKYLLERRGYKIVEDNSDFLLSLQYKTERHNRMKTSSLVNYSSNNTSALVSNSGSLTSFGLGVSIAQTISALSNKSSVSSQNTVESIKSYIHTVSIEIYDVNNEIIWQGSSTWDSHNINLQTEIEPSIQIIISNLPANKENVPLAQKIKKEKEKNYYNLYCKNKWYSCPALPYKITFESVVKSGHKGPSSVDYGIPICIRDPYALAAYVDLMQSAEYVLPTGLKSYDNPLHNSLWNKIELGGTYQLTDNKKINVLIKLRGEKFGYIVEKCWVASDEEFADFENHLENWRKSLIEYYDVFEN